MQTCVILIILISSEYIKDFKYHQVPLKISYLELHNMNMIHDPLFTMDICPCFPKLKFELKKVVWHQSSHPSIVTLNSVFKKNNESTWYILFTTFKVCLVFHLVHLNLVYFMHFLFGTKFMDLFVCDRLYLHHLIKSSNKFAPNWHLTGSSFLLFC